MICDWKVYICDEDGSKFLGKGPIDLLRKIDEYKSLNRAAASMNLSYRKALNMINAAEDGLGVALITRRVGGERGGGSELTPEACALLEKYALFEERVDTAIHRIFEEIFIKSET